MQAQEMAGHLIRRLHQMSVQVFAGYLQKAGFSLTPVQFAALDTIRTHPGLDQASIAARIAYDRATIGGVIDRLEHKGLVKRRISNRDRRAREVTLTPQGHRLHDQVKPIVATLQGDILSGLTPRERTQFLLLAEKALGAPCPGQSSGP